jgi:hypothetical protein
LEVVQEEKTQLSSSLTAVLGVSKRQELYVTNALREVFVEAAAGREEP